MPLTGAALSWALCYLQLTAFLVVMVPKELVVLLGRPGVQQVSLGHRMAAVKNSAPTLLGQVPGSGRDGQAQWGLPSGRKSSRRRRRGGGEWLGFRYRSGLELGL